MSTGAGEWPNWGDGAGFLGSHLCERLIAQGYNVLYVDNYFTGSKETWRICSTFRGNAP